MPKKKLFFNSKKKENIKGASNNIEIKGNHKKKVHLKSSIIVQKNKNKKTGQNINDQIIKKTKYFKDIQVNDFIKLTVRVEKYLKKQQHSLFRDNCKFGNRQFPFCKNKTQFKN
jgi:hypothetical protein